MKKRALIMIVAIIVTITAFVGGTLAWLTDSAEVSTATYTLGNVDISVSPAVYNMYSSAGTLVPGTDVYVYDSINGGAVPDITVEAGSEDCYIFIRVTPSFVTSIEGVVSGIRMSDTVTLTAASFIDYTLLENWTKLGDEYGEVYFCTVTASSTGTPVSIYKTVSSPANVTKEMLDAAENAGIVGVDLSIETYAIQRAGFDTPVAAWIAFNSSSDLLPENSVDGTIIDSTLTDIPTDNGDLTNDNNEGSDVEDEEVVIDDESSADNEDVVIEDEDENDDIVIED